MSEDTCRHLKQCDYCSDKLEDTKPQLSQPVATIQQILVTIERKQIELDTAVSNENRFKLSIEAGIKQHRRAVESAENSLDQARIQLLTELRKFDASMADISVPEGSHA
jgi:hypothetical protein